MSNKLQWTRRAIVQFYQTGDGRHTSPSGLTPSKLPKPARQFWRAARALTGCLATRVLPQWDFRVVARAGRQMLALRARRPAPRMRVAVRKKKEPK